MLVVGGAPEGPARTPVGGTRQPALGGTGPADVTHRRHLASGHRPSPGPGQLVGDRGHGDLRVAVTSPASSRSTRRRTGRGLVGRRVHGRPHPLELGLGRRAQERHRPEEEGQAGEPGHGQAAQHDGHRPAGRRTRRWWSAGRARPRPRCSGRHRRRRRGGRAARARPASNGGGFQWPSSPRIQSGAGGGCAAWWPDPSRGRRPRHGGSCRSSGPVTSAGLQDGEVVPDVGHRAGHVGRVPAGYADQTEARGELGGATGRRSRSARCRPSAVGSTSQRHRWPAQWAQAMVVPWMNSLTCEVTR